MHTRNLHQGRYPIEELVSSFPSLKPYITKNIRGDLTIDFSNPEAVLKLNGALLKHYYQIDFWGIPDGHLCPGIPGRADYLHHLADLLSEENRGKVPVGKKVFGLDVGTGANAIYPIIGSQSYGWRFVGSELSKESCDSAVLNISSNLQLKKRIEIRKQAHSDNILKGIIKPGEEFAFTMCNPPFHDSKKSAVAASERKNKNLGIQSSPLNFGGRSKELWCQGGEVKFISNMIRESLLF